MRDFTEEAALIWAQQHAGMYAGKPEQFGRDVEAVRRGARGTGPEYATEPSRCAYLTARDIAWIAELAATAGARELEPQVAAALRLLAEKGREAP